MTDFVYNTFRKGQANDEISLVGSTFKMMLVSTGYLDVALATRMAQDFVLDVVGSSSQSPQAFEVAGSTGAVARQIIGARAITEVDASNRSDVDAADILFAAVSSQAGRIGAAVLMAELANSDSSGRRLVACYETGFPIDANGGDITLQLSTGGFLQFTT